MGGGRWDVDKWAAYASTRSITSKTKAHEVYTSEKLHNDLNPKDIKFRESRDSVDNPNSNAIIVALDVTGSMSNVLEETIKGLNTFVTELYNRKPIVDPHLMFMGIGDVRAGDSAPLQVTQFEADIRIAEQLEKIYFEQGGGGNSFESYILAWYFAALHTKIDCFEKRNKKGYIFTIGDELPTPDVKKEELFKILGYNPERGFTNEEVLEMVSKKYNVYHIIIEEGSNYDKDVKNAWKKLLGQNAICLSDCRKLSELIVSTIQIAEGESKESVINSWNGDTSVVIAKAVTDLETVNNTESELVEF